LRSVFLSRTLPTHFESLKTIAKGSRCIGAFSREFQISYRVTFIQQHQVIPPATVMPSHLICVFCLSIPGLGANRFAQAASLANTHTTYLATSALTPHAGFTRKDN